MSFCQQHYVYLVINEELRYFKFVPHTPLAFHMDIPKQDINHLDCWDANIFIIMF